LLLSLGLWCKKRTAWVLYKPEQIRKKQLHFTIFPVPRLSFEDTCLSHGDDTPVTDMETGIIPDYLVPLLGAIIKALVLVVVLPLAAAFLLSIPIPSTLALITGTLIIEYGAAPIGLGLGLHPVFVLYVLVCVALGVTLVLFDIFAIMGEHSERVSRFLKRSSDRAKQSSFLTKYGIYGLVPGVMTLGFYVCPPVSWVVGWQKTRSILLIMAGYITISIVTILATMGIFSLVF
jgi:hypothetical protein